jgi:hypothetical protein
MFSLLLKLKVDANLCRFSVFSNDAPEKWTQEKKKAIPSITAEMGREKNKPKSLFEMIKDCLNDTSIMGPKMNPNNKGASSNPKTRCLIR